MRNEEETRESVEMPFRFVGLWWVGGSGRVIATLNTDTVILLECVRTFTPQSDMEVSIELKVQT